MESLKSKITAVLPENARQYFAAGDNDTEILIRFEKCLCSWENEITKEHEKKYVSDVLEISINGYVMECLKIFLEARTFNNAKASICREVFCHRHVGYNMYCIRDTKKLSEQIRSGLEWIFDSSEYEEMLYCAMADFYGQFTGQFSTNEQAIEFLCKYYPKQMLLNRMKERKIADGLYSHILYAGTSSDFGYAYHGIKIIESYIKFMDYRIVKRVLKNYERYRVESNPVHRHQIYSIIAESRLKNKEMYKFLYIDSTLLIRVIDSLLFVDIEEESSGKYVMDYFTMESFVQKKVVVIKNGDETAYAYWNVRDMNKLELIVDEESVLSMELNQERINLRYKGKQESLSFDFDDWMGNRYLSKNFEKDMARYLESIQRNPDFIFSYIYLNNYRNIENQKISFDHRYTYDRREKFCGKIKGQPFPGKFYGEKIYSLSCIVGENGRGKTSIVDFMREVFFKLKECVDQQWLDYEQNMVHMNEAWSAALGMDENTEFLVIFRAGEKDYFFTNIPGIIYDADEITPYTPSVLLREADEDAKILYFSGKISLYEEENKERRTGKKEEYVNSLNQAHNVDYSENISNNRRIRNIQAGEKNVLNRELCYQLTLLRCHDSSKLREWFGESFTKEKFNISGAKYREDLSFQKYLKDPNCQIRHFSSGEYSKFSFLSKLYWCLQGWEWFSREFKALEEKGLFQIREVVQKGDAIVLFIDEGEVYYHPEWQRQFVQILIEMIELYSQSKTVQIILTTNSPFLISDIRDADLVYLPPQENNIVKKTFGQNIHMLLKDSFFMKATIGEFAKKRIEWLVSLLNEGEKSCEEVIKDVNNEFQMNLSTVEELYDYLALIISDIGEEIYRTELMNMLNAFMESNLTRLEMLRRKKKELEAQITALEKNMSGENGK